MKLYDLENNIFQLTGDLMDIKVRKDVKDTVFKENMKGSDLIIARPLGGLQLLELFNYD